MLQRLRDTKPSREGAGPLPALLLDQGQLPALLAQLSRLRRWGLTEVIKEGVGRATRTNGGGDG
jgi:hypothetical protein